MSRWFRHYAGMMRDDKLVRVAIQSKQPIERVVWVWGAILESAAEIDDDGRYDVDAAEIAYFLRADQADIDNVFSALAATGRVAESHVLKWGNRQFQSDRSNERVAAHRQRKREERDQGNGEERARNVDVTLQVRHRNAPETELETETDISGSNEPSARELWKNPPVAVGKQTWDDFKQNRKLKKLGFTVSTYRSVCRDLDTVSLKTGIPPPQLLEHAAAHGWGGIHDPNERKQSNARPQQASLSNVVHRILVNGGVDGRAGEDAGSGRSDIDERGAARALAARGS